MKSIVSLLSILALGFGFFGCAAKEEVPIFGTTTAAPYGVVGNFYSANLASACSTLPLPWPVPSQGLPGGLNFNGTSGEVTGTPNTVGNFTVVFTVTDSTGKTENCAVLFVVHPRTDRLSVDTFGNSVAVPLNTVPSISSMDGRFIAFSATAPLITGVTGQQIYVHDRQTGQPSLVSKDNFGSAGNGGASSAASISADGRFVVFVSTATNFVPSVGGQQIYLHDRQTGQTSLVSKDNFGSAGIGGISSAPSISADGNVVAFVSTATNLVPGAIGQQIYLHDRQVSNTFPNGRTTLVSKDGVGSPSSTGSLSITLLNASPTISADGRYIAYVSTATNLVPSVSGQQIYLHDTDTSQSPNGRTTLISKNESGIAAPIGTLNNSPTISADGRYIAYVSTATNLDLLYPNVSGQQIYRHDTDTSQSPNGRTTLVSKNESGASAIGGSLSTAPAISADGRYIAFVSTATNLDLLYPNINSQQIYRHDTDISQSPNGRTTLVSRDEAGIPADAGALLPAPVITANGAFVAFVSSAANLVTIPPAVPGLNIYVRAMP
jgi:Tol biopolymer transport system component